MAVRLTGRLRRLCRGSGRVLALVVAASVLWLLFDMAALRVSFAGSEYSKLEKRILEDKAAMGRRAKHPRFGFLKMTEAAGTPAAREPKADDPQPNLINKRFGRRRGAPDLPAGPRASRAPEAPAATPEARRIVASERLGGPTGAAAARGGGVVASVTVGALPSFNASLGALLSGVVTAVAEAAETGRAAGKRGASVTRTLVAAAGAALGRGADPEPAARSSVDGKRGEAPARGRHGDGAGAAASRADETRHEADGGRSKPASNDAMNETKSATIVGGRGRVDDGREKQVKNLTSNVIVNVPDNASKAGGVSKMSRDTIKLVDAAHELRAKLAKDTGVARNATSTATHLPAKRKNVHPAPINQTRRTNRAHDEPLVGAASPRRRNVSDASPLNRASRNGTGPGRAGEPRFHRVLAPDATLSPRDPHAPGQYGYGVTVRPEDQELANRRWKEGAFNVFVSDQLPLDRALPDSRPPACAEQMVPDELPPVSVIICFIDETWSTLLRSVHSVLNRSPPGLLRELILVDDFSSKEHLKEKLDKYLVNLPKVRLLRLKERHGLIRARLVGSAMSTGDILLFLDSHVECNVGWLEPLVARIHANRRRIACPVIEVINEKDMSYQHVTDYLRGVFEWPLDFGWRATPLESVAALNLKREDPFPCPVMAGGLFAIDKRYFYELGTYDPGLEVWGGENLELSFKVWMCGGEIEIVPCSRVGHVYRADNPYSFPGGDKVSTVQRNLRRVAEVWLDEYAELFYGHGYGNMLRSHGVLPRGQFAARFVDSSFGDVAAQRELRRRLGCKSFGWYLKNVYPDLRAPLVQADGWVWNEGSNQCLTFINNNTEMLPCIRTGGISKLQQFNYTWWQQLQQGGLCLAALGSDGSVGLESCRPASEPQAWLHSRTEPLVILGIACEFYQTLRGRAERQRCPEADHRASKNRKEEKGESILSSILGAIWESIQKTMNAKHIVKASVRESLCLAQVGKAVKLNLCDVHNAYHRWNFGRYFEK